MVESTGGAAGSVDPAGDQPRLIGNRYEVVRVLGEGSSARTLLCNDQQEGWEVAVKELHFEHLGNWKYLELFEREASVLSRLDHPGIPKVYDFFAAEGASTELYIVQEFIDGPSLKQRMALGPMLGQQDIHELATGLLDVLDYLHGRAPPVLHRDIKPSNVLLRPNGEAVLVDFGGVNFGWRPPGQSGTTVVGTFGYMPPEQLMGQGGATADLYALGATLLHVVTATPPSEFSFDTGRIEVADDLPAPEAMRRLIEALLRPAPRDRPQTAAAALEILNAGAVPSAAADAESSAIVRRDERRIAITSGDGPRFVDMGSPPREIDGEFKDVYKNLVNPLFPSKRLWSSGIQRLALFGYGVIAVVTAGIAPLVYLAHVRNRKRKYTDVFKRGAATRGTILAANKSEIYATFKYEFEADGATYIAFMDYAVEMARFWGQGDTVPVLYDPDAPEECCFVYR